MCLQEEMGPEAVALKEVRAQLNFGEKILSATCFVLLQMPNVYPKSLSAGLSQIFLESEGKTFLRSQLFGREKKLKSARHI